MVDEPNLTPSHGQSKRRSVVGDNREPKNPYPEYPSFKL